jgi:predicted ATPase with chaperone activity
LTVNSRCPRRPTGLTAHARDESLEIAAADHLGSRPANFILIASPNPCPFGGTNLLRLSIQESRLSPRAHDKILRVARTIVDLDGRSEIHGEHVLEAVNFRLLDRQFLS